LFNQHAVDQMAQLLELFSRVAVCAKLVTGHEFHGKGFTFMALQPFTQGNPRHVAVFMELALQPGKQRAVGCRQAAQQGMVLGRQRLQRCHVV